MGWFASVLPAVASIYSSQNKQQMQLPTIDTYKNIVADAKSFQLPNRNTGLLPGEGSSNFAYSMPVGGEQWFRGPTHATLSGVPSASVVATPTSVTNEPSAALPWLQMAGGAAGMLANMNKQQPMQLPNVPVATQIPQQDLLGLLARLSSMGSSSQGGLPRL